MYSGTLLAILCGLACTSGVLSMATNDVTPSCSPDDEVCEFSFEVSRKMTMLLYEGTHDGGIAVPIVSRNGQFFKRMKCGPDDHLVAATKEELARVIMTDGTYRHVTTVNGQFPGPTMVVYEGQEIVVNVTNKLLQEAMSVHWHGIVQKKTNWMDGVAGLTQCAINPMETFTYRFIAYPAGTHWWHSHQGLQRSDGFYGSLIVLPNPKKPQKFKATEPLYNREYIVDVIDFYPVESNLAYTSFMANQKQFMFHGYNKTGHCYGGADKQPDGASAGTFRFISGLINGKGHQYDSNGKPVVDVPLETYMVESGAYYKFRVINAAMTYTFMISVDQHPIKVIASDGGQLMPVDADKVAVNPGERMDFYIKADQPVGNYWLRAETVEKTTHQTTAVLRYNGAPETLPTTSEICTNRDCTVVNCPFQSNGQKFANCINVESLHSSEIDDDDHDDDDDDDDDEGELKELFMAFEKAATPGPKRRNAANGIQHIAPSSPPTVLGYSHYDHDCAKMDCSNKPCQCTYQVKLNLKDTIQIAMFANTTHPMHLHGHLFKVIKVGYPKYDSQTFKSQGLSSDIACNNEMCNQASWADKSWYGGNIPGSNLVDPPIKDTVEIPAGGYVVIQFKAKNPGWWLFHCHIETHLFQGMGLILQVGDEEDMIPPPENFHTCGTYTLSHDDFKEAIKKRKRRNWFGFSKDQENADDWSKREKLLLVGYIVMALVGLILGVVIAVLVMHFRNKKASSNKGVNSDGAKYTPKEEEVALNS